MTEKIIVPVDFVIDMLSGGPDHPLAPEIVPILQEYFTARKAGGVIFQYEDESAPEHPTDARVAAVDRIGTQYGYWTFLPGHILNPKTDLVHVISMDAHMFDPPYDMTGKDISQIHQRVIDRIVGQRKNYRAINLLGDADFWGADQNQIFPMTVRITDADGKPAIARVTVEDIGVDPQQVQSTWESWKMVRRESSGLMKNAMISSLRALDYSSSVVAYLSGFSSGVEIWVYLCQHVESDALDRILVTLSPNLRRVIDEAGEHHPWITSARALAKNLQVLYETARNYLATTDSSLPTQNAIVLSLVDGEWILEDSSGVVYKVPPLLR
jgi:hypothetical protein